VKFRYGWESGTYPTEASTIDKLLGWGMMPNPSRTNNLQESPGVGSRDVQKLIQGGFNGAVTVPWNLTTGWFWRLALGAAPGKTGVGPYSYLYTPSDTLDSATLEWYRPTDAISVSRLLGFKCKSATITGEVNKPVKCKMEGVYANEKHYASSTNTATETEEPFHMGNCALTVGTAYADVQNFDFTVENSTKLMLGLGSILPTGAHGHLRKYTIKARLPYETSTELLDCLGGSSGVVGATNKATGSIVITNAGAGTAERSHTIALANLKMLDHAETVSTDDVLMADITLQALSCSGVTYVCNTSTAP
jgi:hypothetical protein